MKQKKQTFPDPRPLLTKPAIKPVYPDAATYLYIYIDNMVVLCEDLRGAGAAAGDEGHPVDPLLILGVISVGSSLLCRSSPRSSQRRLGSRAGTDHTRLR